MKSLLPFFLPVTLVLFYACEDYNEIEPRCLPTNMTATIIQGSATKKIIADFHYVPETDLVDHITWSNHQTHYFEYDASNRLSVLRQMKVDMKVQEEMWFHYDGAKIEQIELVSRNLDYIYLEPIDSIYTGYIVYEYEGKEIIREKKYVFTEDGKITDMVQEIEYEYDMNGNIISSISSDLQTKSGETLKMTYHESKHPLSEIQYYFTGESFVNNLLSKTMEQAGMDYNYDLKLNEFGYPEIIYETLGSSNTRIIRYAYTCK